MSVRLQHPGLLVISGVSGAGKSSLLRAGMLPVLRRAGLESAPEAASWPCLVFTPTSDPLQELAVRVAPLVRVDAGELRDRLGAEPAGFALTARAAALSGPAGLVPESAPYGPAQRRLLIVVDQCEQLFTRCEDEAAREAFVTALHAAADADDGRNGSAAAAVVLVVRADFEARLADYPQLASAVQHRYLLAPMNRRQLRMAITRPAVAAGSSVDPDLVQVLLEETRYQAAASSSAGSTGAVHAGVLPLLSHALDQAWRSRTGPTLTLADYQRVGGIEGAVARSAENAYGQLTPAQQQVARQVFTLLAATNSDGTITAARATRVALTAGINPGEVRDVAAVLDTFAAARLLTLAAGTVELSHEILLTAWPLYRDNWLAETQADRIARTRLRTAADEWDGAARDPAYLYSGSVLAAASEAAVRIDADPRHAALSLAEKDFLRASQRAGRLRVRRGRAFVTVLAVLVLGLASVTVAVFHANQATARQRDSATSELLASQSLALGETNATVSQVDSIAAWAIDPHSAQARYAMLTPAARRQIATIPVGAPQVYSVQFSPDGKMLATASSDATVQLWNRATLTRIVKPLGDGIRSSAVAFSHDGAMLATGSTDGTVRLWDAATRRQTGAPLRTGSRQPITSLSFSPYGKLLVTVAGGTVQLWKVSSHRLARSRVPVGHSNQFGGPGSREFTTAVFSPDGKMLATGGRDGAARLWDVATGQQVGSSLDHDPSGQIWTVAFSPDGKMLAAGGPRHLCSCSNAAGGVLRLWDVATGRQIGRSLASENIGPVESLAFSPDGGSLASGGDDGTIRLWDVTSRTSSILNSNRSSLVNSVAYSPDGSTLATAGSDGTARLWTPTAVRPAGPPIGTENDAGLSYAVFSPDGQVLAIGATDDVNGYQAGEVQFWDVRTRHRIGRPIKGDRPVSSMAFSPDGKILASCCFSQGIELWDVATHQELRSPIPGTGPLTFSPDGRLLATATPTTGVVRLWDVATDHEVAELIGSIKNTTGTTRWRSARTERSSPRAVRAS